MNSKLLDEQDSKTMLLHMAKFRKRKTVEIFEFMEPIIKWNSIHYLRVVKQESRVVHRMQNSYRQN